VGVGDQQAADAVLHVHPTVGRPCGNSGRVDGEFSDVGGDLVSEVVSLRGGDASDEDAGGGEPC